ncbi:hypothetical protein [Silvimonas iriomotensis]|uniref:Uncharacterized protein n=1 Tax=Silvimonas iriomotensis TaxID=449662 RepID=A0ABQ2PAN8_9NEIS|nr:hypothetical protein [Silvimonas iriomotensis]GGP22051.1 hypothetical protein GCM10010970_23190 [Silvimonas iriomotensis]
MSLSRIFIATALLSQLVQAAAPPQSKTCTLPVPDDGEVKASFPNETGWVDKAGKGFVDIQSTSSERIRVYFNRETQFYTSFGGDYEPTDLAHGQRVWVWFKDCKPAVRGSGTAAFLQLYSRDPADQPM